MSDVLVVSPLTPVAQAVTELDKKREDFANVAEKTGEVLKAYAKAICNAFNDLSTTGEVILPWYDKKGKKAKPIKAERDKFVEVMVARGISTESIDKYWQIGRAHV